MSQMRWCLCIQRDCGTPVLCIMHRQALWYIELFICVWFYGKVRSPKSPNHFKLFQVMAKNLEYVGELSHFRLVLFARQWLLKSFPLKIAHKNEPRVHIYLRQKRQHIYLLQSSLLFCVPFCSVEFSLTYLLIVFGVWVFFLFLFITFRVPSVVTHSSWRVYCRMWNRADKIFLCLFHNIVDRSSH